MSGLAYLVMSVIAYEQPDILAVWLDEAQAHAHVAALDREWHAQRAHLVFPGTSPFCVWMTPLEPKDALDDA